MAAVLKDLDKEAIGYLHGTLVRIFLDGECYALAIAMRRGLGWPMVGLKANGIIRHAAVFNPKGGLYDARGPVLAAEFGKPFSIKPPFDMHSLLENDLRAIRPVHEKSIAIAGAMAEAIWPKLPWVHSRGVKMLAFLEDLEALCRRHGVWIRASVPTSSPILTNAYGDEGGYTLQPTADAMSYTFDRYFKTTH